MVQVDESCDPEPMKGLDTLFVMHTSGTTGGPKGLEHSQAGYLLYAMVTYQVEKSGTSVVVIPILCRYIRQPYAVHEIHLLHIKGDLHV